MLDVGDGNLIYWETCGDPSGKPAKLPATGAEAPAGGSPNVALIAGVPRKFGPSEL